MIRYLVIAAALAVLARAREYYGVKLGALRNTTYGLRGDVWVANENALQITGLDLAKAKEKLALTFYFSTATEVGKAEQLYQVIDSPTGEYSKPISSNLDGGFEGARIVVTIPNGYKKWKFFGVVAEDKWFYLSAVNLNKPAPTPFCCITDRNQPTKGIVGLFYNVDTGPITVLDAKTVKISRFSFEGTKPPDGWIFAGKGRVDRDTGKRAMVVGRDTKEHHCPLKENYYGDSDLIVRLADGQTIYDINYISVLCFEFSADFGHVPFNLLPDRVAVPADIPPVRESPPVLGRPVPC